MAIIIFRLQRNKTFRFELIILAIWPQWQGFLLPFLPVEKK